MNGSDFDLVSLATPCVSIDLSDQLEINLLYRFLSVDSQRSCSHVFCSISAMLRIELLQVKESLDVHHPASPLHKPSGHLETQSASHTPMIKKISKWS